MERNTQDQHREHGLDLELAVEDVWDEGWPETWSAGQGDEAVEEEWDANGAAQNQEEGDAAFEDWQQEEIKHQDQHHEQHEQEHPVECESIEQAMQAREGEDLNFRTPDHEEQEALSESQFL